MSNVEHTAPANTAQPADRPAEAQATPAEAELEAARAAELAGGVSTPPDPPQQAGKFRSADGASRERVVSRMQIQHGNQYVQRVVAQRLAQRRAQRAEADAAAAQSAAHDPVVQRVGPTPTTKTQIQLEYKLPPFGFSDKSRFKYKWKGDATLNIKGTLEQPQSVPGAPSMTNETPDRIALRWGTKLYEQKKLNDNLYIKSVELEGEGIGGGSGDQKGSTGAGIGVHFKVKTYVYGLDNEFKITAYLFKAAGTGGANEVGEMPFDLKVGALEFSDEHQIIKTPNYELGPSQNFMGEVTLKYKVSGEPDKKELGKIIIEKIGKKLGEEGLKKLLGQMVPNVLAELRGFSPLSVGWLAIKIHVQATMASIEDIQKMKGIYKDAVAARDGYVAGYMGAFGSELPKPDRASGKNALTYGTKDGQAALAGAVQRILAEPQFAQQGFTEQTLSYALKDIVKERFHDALLGEVFGRVDMPIKVLYLNKWKESLSFWDITLGNVKGSERNLRFMLGLPLDSDLPDPLAPMDEPAEKDKPKPEVEPLTRNWSLSVPFERNKPQMGKDQIDSLISFGRSVRNEIATFKIESMQGELQKFGMSLQQALSLEIKAIGHVSSGSESSSLAAPRAQNILPLVQTTFGEYAGQIRSSASGASAEKDDNSRVDVTIIFQGFRVVFKTQSATDPKGGMK